MLVLVTTVILYVFGFVFLYGVIRLGVRHGMEDVEAQRAQVARAEQLASLQDRTFARENAFLTGS
ncbi:hypothetical protein EV384_0824 [Micromonospora kangleipakensis]|uniref:Uncharacterized protein n=1 Tax=Micromonospora kangleipakensis TaxID=1077942 RepID=A0A4Q8B4I7_9ACTN|nr:hypothetical protein [Micromonospora kangleipakensis]RZU72457.1 hypothetical protein EV384_0824 [Micromonospora kangleipakensis]